MDNSSSKIIKIILIIIISIILDGCYSKYPLSERGEYKYNKKLIGVWKFSSDSDAAGYAHVASSYDRNIINIVSVTHPKKGNFTVRRYEAFAATEINSVGYLSLLDKAKMNDGYHFVKYEFTSDDILNICAISMDDLVKVVKSKRLSGNLGKKRKFTNLIGSTDQLRKYFISPERQDIFGNCKEANKLKGIKESDPLILFMGRSI